MACPRALEREARRVLPHLAAGARLRRLGAGFVLAGVTGAGRVSAADAEAMRAAGWLAWEDDAFVLAPAGTGRLEAWRAQGLVPAAPAPGALTYLRKRADHGGRAWLAPEHVEAAERLARDFEFSGRRPRVTMNWERPPGDARTAASGSPGQGAIDAGRRCAAALEAVGGEMADALFRAVCLGAGLTEVERRFDWPARSGKTVLRLALDRLAAHYGLIAGGRREGRVEAWRAALAETA